MKNLLTLVVFLFVVFCGLLIANSGLFENPQRPTQPCVLLQQTTVDQGQQFMPDATQESEYIEAADLEEFSAVGGTKETLMLGSVDPKSGYKFQLQLTSTGAAIKQATLSEFDNRDYENPQPLVLISPVAAGPGRQVFSLANGQLLLVQQKQQLPLDRLSWESFPAETGYSPQTARFEATIVDSADKPVIKLTKTYTVIPDSYLLECELTIENLSDIEQEMCFDLAGPGGIGREGVRGDMRKVIAGFMDSERQVKSKRLDANKLKRPKIEYLKAYLTYLNPYRKWWAFWEPLAERKKKAKETMQMAKGQISSLQLLSSSSEAHPIWIAVANKYFAAILRPVPDDEKEKWPDWIAGDHVEYYDPDLNITEHLSVDEMEEALKKQPDGDETVFAMLKISPASFAASGENNSTRTYGFQLYLGPKDKSLFDKHELYRELAFVQTIDFLACCCPASIIRPLAFGILALMKWMYGFIHNYGVVIIILVFLMRLVMHPVTKKSQVSMSKMSKLAPKAEEIKKKYANNKAEMNKQLMALYKEQGASPIMGMLPMMVQMPIWIALWSAVYSSIDLRGAAFLPFWITDLSIPDALFRFPPVTLPLFGKLDSFNLLPILMGVAFYLQQKLMPSQAQASANPQVAQQQKMMMIMLPLLFPLMLYKAPSGVNLYIMASTFAGVIEQYIIRKHIQKKEEEESKGLVAATSKTGGKVKKKKPKPFFKI